MPSYRLHEPAPHPIPTVTAIDWPGENEQTGFPSFIPCERCASGSSWLLFIPLLKREIREYYCDTCIVKLPDLMRRFLLAMRK